MKKILLGTTGLVGAALLATAASAETPKVTLGGFSDFQAGYSDSDTSDTGAVSDDSSISFRNDNEISVRVDGKTDAGLGYGAVIDVEADTTSDADFQGTNAARTFTYLEGGWGRVELGDNKSAASTMRVDASTLAVATGGINGDWRHFLDASGFNQTAGGDPTGAGGGAFITNSKLQAEHGATDFVGDESTYNSTKITYYSPRWSGFQFGASYTPDLDGKGQVNQRLEDGYSDVVDLGIGYETTFDNSTKLALSGTYEMADGDVAGTDDLEGWNIGALLGIWGLNFAGSWGEWSEGGFGLRNAAVGGANTTGAFTGADGQYWTAGVGYDMGAIGLSATYLDSELEPATGAGDNEFDNLVIGADYKLAPGLTPYAELSLYDFDAAGGGVDDDGAVFILGTQLAF